MSLLANLAIALYLAITLFVVLHAILFGFPGSRQSNGKHAVLVPSLSRRFFR